MVEVDMAQSVDIQHDLMQSRQNLVDEIEKRISQVIDIRKNLANSISQSIKKLERVLHCKPGKPSSHYWNVITSFWVSFELLKERMENTHKTLSRGIERDPYWSSFTQSDSLAELEQHIETLEDLLDSYRSHRLERGDLTIFIELLDSTDRLSVLKLPNLKDQGTEYAEALVFIRKIVREIGNDLKSAVTQHGINPLEICKGDYPPPETTRIVARLDNRTDDDVVIREIVLPGYLWHSKLLRKADVIVISK
jgi:molecular chaperone GrpE (heat shock protein)